MKKNNIVIAGEGGQGIQTISKILTISAAESGLEVSIMPSFGVEQRGTPSLTFITIANSPIRVPRFDFADIVVVLQHRAVKAIDPYVSPSTKVYFDSSTILSSSLPKTALLQFGIPATKYASEKFTPKSFNIVVLGFLSKMFELDTEKVWKNVEKVLGSKFKTSKVSEQNKEALLFGYDMVPEKDSFTKPIYKPKHKTIVVRGFGKCGQILPNLCKGCGICIEKCPVAALSFSDDLGVFATPIPQVDLEKCIACGNCRAFCPDGAIGMQKENK